MKIEHDDVKRWKKRRKKEEKRKQESMMSSVAQTSVAGQDEYEGIGVRLSTDTGKDTVHEDTDSEERNKIDYAYEIEIPMYHNRKLAEASGESSKTEDKKPRLLETMLISDVASTLARTDLSDRKFILLAATAKANDEDLSTAPLLHSTVYRKRSSHRSVIASDVCKEFMSSEKAALVVHWNGKI